MDPLEEQVRLESVRRALLILHKGASVSRNTVFPENAKVSREWCRKILNRLVERGIVRAFVKPGINGKVYQVKDVFKLDELMATDESIADFIWASNVPPTLEQLGKQVEAAIEAVEPKKPDPPVAMPKAVVVRLPEAGRITIPQAEAAARAAGAPVMTPPAPVMLAPPPMSFPVPAPVPAPGTIDPMAETNRLLNELILTMEAATQCMIYVKDVVTELKKMQIAGSDKLIDELKRKVDEALLGPSGGGKK